MWQINGFADMDWNSLEQELDEWENKLNGLKASANLVGHDFIEDLEIRFEILKSETTSFRSEHSRKMGNLAENMEVEAKTFKDREK